MDRLLNLNPMDIEEQKNLAKSFNLSSKTPSELIQLLQKSIKSKFGIYSKTDKRNMMLDWFETEVNRLVSQGMEEEAAEEQAYEYAEELWNRSQRSINNIPPYHFWTIEKEIDDVVYDSVMQINENENCEIKIFTFDAKSSSLEEYKRLLKTIDESQVASVLLIKYFAMAKGVLFEWLRDDIKHWSEKKYSAIITTPLISETPTQSMIGLGILQTALISE